MGHDGNKKFCARATANNDWECFYAKKHPDGGYLLLVMHWGKLLQMSIKEDTNELVGTGNGGTVWEFVRVYI